jgi:hypothetical protein
MRHTKELYLLKRTEAVLLNKIIAIMESNITNVDIINIAGPLGFDSLDEAKGFVDSLDLSRSNLQIDQLQLLRLIKQWLNKCKTCTENLILEKDDYLKNKEMRILLRESKLYSKHLSQYLSDPLFSSYFRPVQAAS